MPSLKQTVVNKRPWTGVEENNPSSLETTEKRFRMDEQSGEPSGEPSDQPTDEPNVSIAAESSTESDNDQVSIYLVQNANIASKIV